MHKKMIASRSFKYGTRRLQAGDTFEAPLQHGRVLVAIERATFAREPIAPPPASLAKKLTIKQEVATQTETEQEDGIATARAEYQAAVGKRPFMGWDAAEIRRRMADAIE